MYYVTNVNMISFTVLVQYGADVVVCGIANVCTYICNLYFVNLCHITVRYSTLHGELWNIVAEKYFLVVRYYVFLMT